MELPLAIPIIFAGIRVAAVNVVATATIAPLGSVDSLGTPIISANVYGADGRLGAAIAVTVLTLAISGGITALQVAVTPRGLKLGASRLGSCSIRRRRTSDMTRKFNSRALAALVMAFGAAACGDDDESSGGGGGGGGGPRLLRQPDREVPDAAAAGTISVGSKNFTEQYILGNIYADALAAAGFKVKKSLDLGSEVVAYKALQQGEVDAYPEYTGTALTSFFQVPGHGGAEGSAEAFDQMHHELKASRLTALPQTPFENSYRLAIGKEKRESRQPEDDVRARGQVEGPADLRLPRVQAARRLPAGHPEHLRAEVRKFVASQQQYDVLDNGSSDVLFGFTTDGELTTGKYAILDDDKQLLPAVLRLAADQQRRAEEDRAGGPEGDRGGPEAAHREGDG